MPSPEAAAVLELNNNLRDAWLADPEYTYDDMRRIFDVWLTQLEIPAAAKFTEVTCNGVPCIWADMPGVATDRLVIHYHSGGYLLGSANGYRSFGAFLSEATGCRVLLPDYRLAPENPYPAGIEDGVAVYRWALDHGFAPDKIVLCGDSAGGGLTLGALHTIRDRKLPMPAAGVSISPLADFARTGESHQTNIPHDPLVTPEMLAGMGTTYCGEMDKKHPGLSPLYAEWSGLPPLLVLGGEIEMLRDDGKLCAEAAKRAGVDATYFEGKDMAHIWTLFADRLPEAREGLAVIGAFIRKHMAA